MLIPTAVSPPPRLSAPNNTDSNNDADSTEMFGNDIMTVPISLAGLSAVNVPLGPVHASADENPAEAITGLQLVGPRLQEEGILAVALYLK